MNDHRTKMKPGEFGNDAGFWMLDRIERLPARVAARSDRWLRQRLAMILQRELASEGPYRAILLAEAARRFG